LSPSEFSDRKLLLIAKYILEQHGRVGKELTPYQIVKFAKRDTKLPRDGIFTDRMSELLVKSHVMNVGVFYRILRARTKRFGLVKWRKLPKSDELLPQLQELGEFRPEDVRRILTSLLDHEPHKSAPHAYLRQFRENGSVKRIGVGLYEVVG
jgi:hypothetical protein